MTDRYLVVTGFSKLDNSLNVNPLTLRANRGDNIYLLTPEWPSSSSLEGSWSLEFADNPLIPPPDEDMLKPGVLLLIGSIGAKTPNGSYSYTLKITINKTTYQEDPTILVDDN
ncbi:MAG: hypothetical protein OQJ89_16700 [Kangiellaceae bacterium]|nr:hypothetical protein [Kangiellaceae bacterium]MCW9001006.1 hypothetical protein [Kangiellaceae bacterium]MCW9018615.1 hypothetical protein [Kangiellaceae bacterium]